MNKNYDTFNLVVNKLPFSCPHFWTLGSETVFLFIGPAIAITATSGYAIGLRPDKNADILA